MYRYWCYGLNVHSEIAIPEFVSSDVAQPDITIRYGRTDRLKVDKEELGASQIDVVPGIIRYWMHGVGGLEIRDGREIIIDPVDGAEEKGFRFLVSGMGMGFVLHQRGIASLHASAVAIDGQAVAFVGWKRMGKSSTAAAFHARGYPVLTDDVLALHREQGGVTVAPAFPHLKLWPESVSAVFKEDPDVLPKIHPDGIKRTRSVEAGFMRAKLPLRHVYVLDWLEDGVGDEVRTEQCAPGVACVELMRHSFALRMFQEREASAEQLNQMAELAKPLRVKRLRRPFDVEQIGDVVALILHEVAGSKPVTPVTRDAPSGDAARA